MKKLIAQGAEAKLFVTDGEIIKERVRKGYRLKQLDESIRKSRTRREAKLLSDARRVGVLTPRIFETSNYSIVMELLKGEKVKDILNNLSSKERKELCEKIGEYIALLHSHNLIHGDLTTSNMILVDGKLYFIDFGLGSHSTSIEDKAIDLYLMYHALVSTHFQVLDDAWKVILSGYKNYSEWKEVLKRIENIKKRWRYAAR